MKIMQKTGQLTSYKSISYTEYTYPQGGIYEPKTYVNNQWKNNNLLYYPYKTKRQDGPGGN